MERNKQTNKNIPTLWDTLKSVTDASLEYPGERRRNT